ncbi:MAG: hypothetical protein RLZZ385_989 [Pseudomonadota bacterium]|jgi:O-acetyl-ADP-ribose deacetylase (regulator of RNase III)
MIHEVEGDILLTKAQVIAHGVAANDPMNQGLALSLHKQFPAMHKDFHHWCNTSHPKPGQAWLWSGAGKEGGRPVHIVNLLTQEGGYDGKKPGPASETHVNHSLRELRKLVEKNNFSSIALPRLATGVGGLDWSRVKPLIESQLGDLAVPIYVYTIFQAGQQANESGL